MERFIKNFQRVKKEVEELGATGEQILVEFVKSYQNLKDEKSEFGSAIDVNVVISKNGVKFEAKPKHGNIEIITSAPTTCSLPNDDKEINMTGYILVK